MGNGSAGKHCHQPSGKAAQPAHPSHRWMRVGIWNDQVSVSLSSNLPRQRRGYVEAADTGCSRGTFVQMGHAHPLQPVDLLWSGGCVTGIAPLNNCPKMSCLEVMWTQQAEELLCRMSLLVPGGGLTDWCELSCGVDAAQPVLRCLCGPLANLIELVCLKLGSQIHT